MYIAFLSRAPFLPVSCSFPFLQPSVVGLLLLFSMPPPRLSSCFELFSSSSSFFSSSSSSLLDLFSFLSALTRPQEGGVVSSLTETKLLAAEKLKIGEGKNVTDEKSFDCCSQIVLTVTWMYNKHEDAAVGIYRDPSDLQLLVCFIPNLPQKLSLLYVHERKLCKGKNISTTSLNTLILGKNHQRESSSAVRAKKRQCI